jgi:ferredoxin--NADP+ reductase
LKTRIVTSIKEIRKDVYILSFKRDFNFVPGQVIGITDNSEIPPRLYSIASGNKEDFVLILFDVKDGGLLTPRLASLDSRSTILTTLPTGNFICNESNAYWIASGTGIAPFASMFFSGLAFHKTLIHGGRTLDSFYFDKEFTAEMGENYIRCYSGKLAPDIYNGRLTTYLREKNDLPATIKYYLCGSAEMVVEARDILLAKNIPFNNIIAEIYF